MKYVLSIYDDEGAWEQFSPQEAGAIIDEYGRFSEEARAAGKFVAGEGLEGSSTATTVRVRDGERLLTDGPFAETKEQLGGFYVLECENLDEALAYAAKIPAAEHGSIEVRPVWTM